MGIRQMWKNPLTGLIKEYDTWNADLAPVVAVWLRNLVVTLGFGRHSCFGPNLPSAIFLEGSTNLACFAIMLKLKWVLGNGPLGNFGGIVLWECVEIGPLKLHGHFFEFPETQGEKGALKQSPHTDTEHFWARG